METTLPSVMIVKSLVQSLFSIRCLSYQHLKILVPQVGRKISVIHVAAVEFHVERFLTLVLRRRKDKLSAQIEGQSSVKGFNSRFLLDALHSVETDKILLKMNPSPVEAVCIYPTEGDSFLHMILPVRLPDER